MYCSENQGSFRNYEKPNPWEYDEDGYTAAVRCANAVRGIYVEITEEFLAEARILEEGHALVELWNKKRVPLANPSEEFKRFDRIMRRLMHVQHEKPKGRPH